MADNPTLAAPEALFHDAAMTDAEQRTSTPEESACARDLHARIETVNVTLVGIGPSGRKK